MTLFIENNQTVIITDEPQILFPRETLEQAFQQLRRSRRLTQDHDSLFGLILHSVHLFINFMEYYLIFTVITTIILYLIQRIVIAYPHQFGVR